MRLVPNQDPVEIMGLVENHLRNLTSSTVVLELRLLGKAQPALIDSHAPAVQATAQAYQHGFKAEPIYMRGGGSQPIVSDMIAQLSPPDGSDIPVVMIGFGLPDDNTHAPNEKLHLPNFYNGINTVIHYLHLLSQQ